MVEVSSLCACWGFWGFGFGFWGVWVVLVGCVTVLAGEEGWCDPKGSRGGSSVAHTV